MPHRSHAPESLAKMSPRRGARTQKVSDYFGCNVFGPETMRLLLP